MKNLKKSIMTIVASILVFSSVTTCCIAAPEVSVGTLDVCENTSEYDEVVETLQERGTEILNQLNPKTRAIVKFFDIERLLQSDSRWGSVKLGNTNVSMASEGCCITSFTMIHRYLSGSADTPADVNTKLGTNGYPLNYSKAAETYGYTIKAAHSVAMTDANATATIIGAMDTYSLPVLVGMQSSSTTHFVVASGYNSGGGILIRDPASTTYTLLSQYLDKGYEVNRIYVFGK